VVPKHFSMLGKAMRFATMCAWSFAICGKANRHNIAAVSNATIEDFEHRVGNETNFEDHSSTTKTVTSTPIRKTSSTGSSTQVRRLAKILLLGSSVFSAAASAPRGVQPAGFRALQQDGNIDLEHGGILGPTSWENSELASARFEADLLDENNLGAGWGVQDRGLKLHERPFGVGRNTHPSSNTKASPSKHKIFIRAKELFDKFVKPEMGYTDTDGVHKVLDVDKFVNTHAVYQGTFRNWVSLFVQNPKFTNEMWIKFFTDHTVGHHLKQDLFRWLISPHLHPSEKGSLDILDRMKAMDIMTDA